MLLILVKTDPYTACHSSPCLHGGTCLDSSNTADVAFNANGYKCLCVEGFRGINCEGGPLKKETYLNFQKGQLQI